MQNQFKFGVSQRVGPNGKKYLVNNPGYAGNMVATAQWIANCMTTLGLL
jgi:hypothetical protein